METKETLTGFAVVVADRGFVYVGQVEIGDKWCVITHARNIRKWGTSQGLAEIVNGGPTADTVLDAEMAVRVPIRAVISVIDTEAAKWNAS